MKRYLVLLLLLLLHIETSYANFSLDVENADLAATLLQTARLLNVNLILSPAINGLVTMHLAQAQPRQAFDVLLTVNGLAKWQRGNVWYVGTQAELSKLKQEEMKWQELADNSAPLLMRIWQVNYANAEEVVSMIKDEHGTLLSKRGQIRADKRTNTIFVKDSADNLTSIYALIKRLDVPIKQVVIYARLASVDSDIEQALGVHFDVEDGADAAKAQPGRYSIALARLADGSLLDIKLAALENAGRAELISSPSLFTANQQSASIEAGEEVPYQEVSESGGTAVVFKKAVLSLNVTPQILPGKKVLLQLKINQDRPGNRLVQGVPTISTRQIITHIEARSGETIVLGGIFERNHENGQKRLPFISQVPLLGWLFKAQNTRENKRELLIFVTPKIITQEA